MRLEFVWELIHFLLWTLPALSLVLLFFSLYKRTFIILINFFSRSIPTRNSSHSSCSCEQMGSQFVWWTSGSRSRAFCCFFGCCTNGLSRSTCSVCVHCAAACDSSSDEWQLCSLVARNVHCCSSPTSLMASRVALTGAAANVRPIGSSRRAGALRIYRTRLYT